MDKHTAIRFYGPQAIDSLFDTVEWIVGSADGDGDGLIISESYLAWAELFEEHEAKEQSWGYRRVGMSTNGCIVFSLGQNNIIFSNTSENLPFYCGGDIRIALP